MPFPASCPSQRLAARFLDLYRRGIETDPAVVDHLAEQALRDMEAVEAFYSIVEGLCDDFSPAGVALCNRLLLRLLAAARRLPVLADMDRWLSAVGFEQEEGLLDRYRRLLAVRPQEREPAVIAVLSRVTIGADVAITSILLQRLRRRYPAAEFLLLGPAHLAQLFGGMAGVRLAVLPFSRRGSIPERLGCPAGIHRLLLQEAAMAGGPLALIDPDSRLSQLGLQPLWPEQWTWYFPSRLLGGEEEGLARLVNQWCDTMWGEDEFAWPAVFPAERYRRFADRLHRRLGRRPLCVVNFGVGGNPAKRIVDPFEEDLIATLTDRWPGVVLYDAGRSPLALERVRAALARAAAAGRRVGFVDEMGAEETAGSPLHRCRLVGFRGAIGALAALLFRAAAFVGYDSCCQHLAAAAGVPGVVVFAGAPHRRFLNRWRPRNRHASLVVVPVDDGRRPGGEGPAALQAVANLVEEVAAILTARCKTG